MWRREADADDFGSQDALKLAETCAMDVARQDVHARYSGIVYLPASLLVYLENAAVTSPTEPLVP